MANHYLISDFFSKKITPPPQLFHLKYHGPYKYSFYSEYSRRLRTIFVSYLLLITMSRVEPFSHAGRMLFLILKHLFKEKFVNLRLVHWRIDRCFTIEGLFLID